MAERDNYKRYIGDGVYVSFDGYQLWLTTEDGYSVTNRIALEPTVWAQLRDYVEALRAREDTGPEAEVEESLPVEPAPDASGKVIDLMEALKASLSKESTNG